MIRKVGEHAIVLGAGISGLLAARVLTDFYGRVTLVERDALGVGLPRKGVPQGFHAHALLPRGLQILEELFPGLTGELVAGGAMPYEMIVQLRMIMGVTSSRGCRPARRGCRRPGRSWRVMSCAGCATCRVW